MAYFMLEEQFMDAFLRPEIAAPPGYFLLNESDPLSSPEPVIGWKIGQWATLAVTKTGCSRGEHFVLGPDGIVERKFRCFGANIPVTWPSVERWREELQLARNQFQYRAVLRGKLQKNT